MLPPRVRVLYYYISRDVEIPLATSIITPPDDVSLYVRRSGGLLSAGWRRAHGRDVRSLFLRMYDTCPAAGWGHA